jgi:hypothetical protein
MTDDPPDSRQISAGEANVWLFGWTLPRFGRRVEGWPLGASRSFALLRRSRSVNVLVETAVMGTSVRPPRTGGAVKRTTLLHISTVVIGIATLAWIGSRHGIAIVRPSTEREIAKRRDPQVVTVEWHRAVVELFVVRIARKIGNSGRRSPGAGAATYVVSFGRRGWRMEARTFLSTTSCWRSFWCW